MLDKIRTTMSDPHVNHRLNGAAAWALLGFGGFALTLSLSHQAAQAAPAVQSTPVAEARMYCESIEDGASIGRIATIRNAVHDTETPTESVTAVTTIARTYCPTDISVVTQ